MITPLDPQVDPSRCGFNTSGDAAAPVYCHQPATRHIWWQQVDEHTGEMINSMACESHWLATDVEDVYLTHPYRTGGSACGVVGSIWDDVDNTCKAGDEPDDELRAILEAEIGESHHA